MRLSHESSGSNGFRRWKKFRVFEVEGYFGLSELLFSDVNVIKLNSSLIGKANCFGSYKETKKNIYNYNLVLGKVLKSRRNFSKLSR